MIVIIAYNKIYNIQYMYNFYVSTNNVKFRFNDKLLFTYDKNNSEHGVILYYNG